MRLPYGFRMGFFVGVQAEAKGFEVELSNLKVLFGYEHNSTQVHVI